MAFDEGGVKKQVRFDQPYKHKRYINNYILFMNFTFQ